MKPHRSYQPRQPGRNIRYRDQSQQVRAQLMLQQARTLSRSFCLHDIFLIEVIV